MRIMETDSYRSLGALSSPFSVLILFVLPNTQPSSKKKTTNYSHEGYKDKHGLKSDDNGDPI